MDNRRRTVCKFDRVYQERKESPRSGRRDQRDMFERKCCLGSMREWNRARGRFRTGKRNHVRWTGASTLVLFHLTRLPPLHILFEPSTLHKSRLAHALFDAGHTKPPTPQRACEGRFYYTQGHVWLALGGTVENHPTRCCYFPLHPMSLQRGPHVTVSSAPKRLDVKPTPVLQCVRRHPA